VSVAWSAGSPPTRWRRPGGGHEPPALVNDGIPAFLVLLLLAMSLVAVIRLRRWVGSPPDQDAQDEPGQRHGPVR